MIAEGISNLLGIRIQGVAAYALFGIIFGSIIALGAKWIDRTNIILFCGLILSYLVTVGIGFSDVSVENLTQKKNASPLFALPILFTAFGYHNVIPSMVTYFGKDKRALKLSLIIGSGAVFVICCVWQWFFMGIVPIAYMDRVSTEGELVTTALKIFTGQKVIHYTGQAFAFFALATSLIGVSFSMVDFFADGLKVSRKGFKRIVLTCLVFLPPFIFVMIYPAIFDKALSIAGGLGEAILNGLVPISFVWIGRYKLGLDRKFDINKFTLVLLASLIVMVMVIEIVQLW